MALTLQARDAAGNNLTLGGATVLFTSTGGTSTGTIGPTTDHANGTYTASFTGVIAGTATTIGVTIDGVVVTSTLPTLAVTPGPISAANSVVTVSAPTVASGSAVTLTLQARDAARNNLTLGGATVLFTSTGGTSTGTIGPTTDHANGTYTASLTGVIAGTATTIGATIDGVVVTSTLPTLAVTPGPISAASSVVTVSAPTVASGSAVTLTLQARDAAGNNLTLGGASVVFTSTGGTSTGTIGQTKDAGSGIYTASFTGLRAGTATTIGATINGVAATGSALPQLSVVAGAPISLVIRPSLLVLSPGATDSIRLTALDSLGNHAPTSAAVVSVQPAGVATASGVVVAGVNNGIASVVAHLAGLSDTAVVAVASGGTLVVRLDEGAPLARDTLVGVLQSLVLDVVVDASRLADKRVGSFTFDLSWNPAVLRVDSVSTVTVATFFANLSQRTTGLLRFGGFSATGLPALAVVARVSVTAVGASGARTRLTVVAEDLTEVSTLEDLRVSTLVIDGRVRIQ